jgi:hypothetical protein
MKPHKHCELIKQWADGAEIEVFDARDNCWEVCTPGWYEGVEYRIHDPYRELKEAAKDPTKQIRWQDGDWKDVGATWEWSSSPKDYEIRDKPVEKKKVKLQLQAWLVERELRWFDDLYEPNSSWVRVPSEDKEIEV